MDFLEIECSYPRRNGHLNTRGCKKAAFFARGSAARVETLRNRQSSDCGPYGPDCGHTALNAKADTGKLARGIGSDARNRLARP
jgi:hypothetical protein